MSRRDRRGEGRERPSLSSPFRELRKIVGDLPPARKAPRRAEVAPRTGETSEEDDESLFRSATAGAVPISPEDRNLAPGPPPAAPPSSSPAQREALEVLSHLNELVNGGSRLEVSDTDEHAEGWVVGLDPRVLQRLRTGEFATQAHIDLHGMTVEEARESVRQFVLRALRAGHRCILIVHGRGRNSPDRRPVLKDALKRWLSTGELAHVVLAFSTARACDGGAGATYVLLRRQRRPRKPFRTLDGAKS